MTSFELFGAFLLDGALGDPPRWPHPVRWIGRAIAWGEGILRPKRSDPGLERVGGIVLALALPFLAYMVSAGALALAGRLGWLFQTAVLLYLAYTTLAMRSLRDAALAVARALENADLPAARAALSEMVSRETKDLSEEEVIRGTIESVAENASDGVGAPLFYLTVGGVPLAMAYKAVNTLDSMVGYRNDRYRYFGWASARLDDLANYIPARLTALFILIASPVVGGAPIQTAKIILRDGRKDDSPNSPVPEAAVAGALRIALGGPSRYAGQIIDKPVIGEAIEKLTVEHIRRAVRLVTVAMGMMLAIIVLLVWVLSHL
ncbi:MAG TPA: adenosylcobinamide-phosphate synthase CbiB [Candidatus Manganitrophaceae bacterium]|nr:adenosylcobinamide-phosphate synthase CbiB [Candidatus Manganitrophaceae bacterium]